MLALFSLKLKIVLGSKLKRLHFNWLYILPNTEAQKLAIKNRIISKDEDLMKLTRYETGITSLFFRMIRPVTRFIHRLKPVS